jgi:hypothetical protein
MPRNMLKLWGFRELRAELQEFPTGIRDESAPIMLRGARRAENAIRTAYPMGPTGNLKKGVKVLARLAEGIAVFFKVAATAPHTHLYEFGTVKQPARPTFYPIANRERRAAVLEVAALVESKGLEVRGARD